MGVQQERTEDSQSELRRPIPIRDITYEERLGIEAVIGNHTLLTFGVEFPGKDYEPNVSLSQESVSIQAIDEGNFPVYFVVPQGVKVTAISKEMILLHTDIFYEAPNGMKGVISYLPRKYTLGGIHEVIIPPTKRKRNKPFFKKNLDVWTQLRESHTAYPLIPSEKPKYGIIFIHSGVRQNENDWIRVLLVG